MPLASSPDTRVPRNPYLAILRTPGAFAFSLSGIIARMPMAMVGIGTILMIEKLYGGYTLAGQVSATGVIAQAICSPQIARLVDRFGQRRVLLPLLGISVVSLAGMVLCAVLRSPAWTLFALAALSGATSGSYGAMVRARWSYVLANPKKLHTAYSLESVFDELVFVIGPALTAFLATSVTAAAGLILPLFAATCGGLWFLSQRTTEPPIISVTHEDTHRSAVLAPGMITLALIFVTMGIVFGATDVATIAFAKEQGREAMSGVILGVFAAGSGISGLLYGMRHWTSPLWRRFVIGVAAMACGVSLFFFTTSLSMLAAAMFVVGFSIAPTIVNGNGLVQILVAPNQLTEGLAWVGTSLGVGVSIGSWIAGARVDAAGAHAGFQIVMAAGALAMLLAALGLRTLRRRTPD